MQIVDGTNLSDLFLEENGKVGKHCRLAETVKSLVEVVVVVDNSLLCSVGRKITLHLC